MKAILIKWTSAQRNYDNPIRGIDYNVLSSTGDFPSADPDFNPTMPNPLEEILIPITVVNNSIPDMRVFNEVVLTKPTQTKHETFRNVNTYQTSSSYEYRSAEELIDVVKQREREANMSINLIADTEKLKMFSGPVLAKYGRIPLNETEQKIYDREMEVQSCGIANDANARRLISVAENNENQANEKQLFDINEGWRETEEWITKIDIPFNEL